MIGCKGCKARDKHIDSLNEQIDWLRTNAGTPSRTALHQQGRTAKDDPNFYGGEQAWVSEEEEEVAAMQQAGLIDTTEAEKALERIGALNTEIYVEG